MPRRECSIFACPALAGCVPDVDGGSGFDPALGTAREAARDALHAREIQRLNDLIPGGGFEGFSR